MSNFNPAVSAIHRGDCVEFLDQWPRAFARLVFADPPFNIGYRYSGYDDARAYNEYVDWSRCWMQAAARALTPDGSFYVAIGDDYAAELRVIGREIGLTLRNWIIWHYQFGQNTRDKFVRAHTHILYFVKNPRNMVFRADQTRFPSARHTEYADRRAKPEGRLPDDVWTEFPRVCGTFKERQGWHGCQMPEALLSRIIRVSSDPGDVVLDPFAGSGTTPATAVKLGRIGIAIEQSEEYAAAATQRLALATREAIAWRVPDADGWSEFDRESLRNLYRETETSIDSLASNAAALACVEASLAARIGRPIPADLIVAKLRELDSANSLPRFKNDRPFRAKVHRKADFARDRKMVKAWHRGLPPKLKELNELGRKTG